MTSANPKYNPSYSFLENTFEGVSWTRIVIYKHMLYQLLVVCKIFVLYTQIID